MSICTDNTNIYVTGYFYDQSLNFYDSNENIDASLYKKGTTNVRNSYITKYDLYGNCIWAITIQGNNNNEPSSICINNSNFYVTGYFNDDRINFYDKTGKIDAFLTKTTSIIYSDTYIGKYDLDGNCLWASKVEGNNDNRPLSICVTTIPSPISNICFLEGTPVVTDQGIIEIQNITNKNTINNIKVKHITETISNDEYLICIEKDSLSENVPSQKTVLTKNHHLLYNGSLVEANDIPNGKRIKYNKETLYNVLLEENGVMLVNNLICETLDINNAISLLYDHPNKYNITNTLNKLMIEGNIELYKKNAIELLS
jgi:hypothetical protein